MEWPQDREGLRSSADAQRLKPQHLYRERVVADLQGLIVEMARRFEHARGGLTLVFRKQGDERRAQEA